MAVDPDNHEVMVTLGSIEDESKFAMVWAEFTLNTPYFLINESDWKQFACLWFKKGIGHGIEWSMSILDETSSKNGNSENI